MSLLWFHFILLLGMYLKLQIHYRCVCSCSSAARGTGPGGLLKHLHFVLVSVFSELQLAQWRSQGFWYIILLMASVWFLRLYLHYLSQWLFLRAISTPVTKWVLSPTSQRDVFSSWSAKWKCKLLSVHLPKDLKCGYDLKRQKCLYLRARRSITVIVSSYGPV